MFHFILRSFQYYWKNHLGLLFGGFLASAILSGSLVVGDSVRASLAKAAADRLGKVQNALIGNDRWFTQRMVKETGGVPIIQLSGAVSQATGQARANGVQVLGVDEKFWALSPSGAAVLMKPDDLLVNPSLAHRLGAKVGDTVIIRLEKPSAISRDAPLSGDTGADVTVRRAITGIVDADHFGSYQLTAAQTPPDSAYLPLAALAEVVGEKNLANVALFPSGADPAKLDSHARLEDYALKLSPVPGEAGQWNLTTDRVFLDESVVKHTILTEPSDAKTLSYHGFPVTTYLINAIRSDHGAAPYSFVTATDQGLPKAVQVALTTPPANDQAPPIVVTDWLAQDQNLKLGDTVSLSYFVVGDGRRLREDTTKFRVADIMPIAELGAGAASWTPDFPGVSESKNCRDWQPGIPMKLDTIRDKDEAYWKQYKGTPKAFIPLAMGEKLWGNRFGQHTSVRIIAPNVKEAALRATLAHRLHLADIGLVPRDVKEAAAAAAHGSVDFGGLFVGLSLFLIAGTLVFAALLFVFTLEKRAAQVGLLLAIGWRVKQARRAVLGEAGLVALLGTVLGLFGGVIYTKLALAGLNGAWSGATVGLTLVYHAAPETLAIAVVASVLATCGTLWFASRRLFKTRPTDLLSGEAWTPAPKKKKSKEPSTDAPRRGWLAAWPWWSSAILVLSAVGLSLAGGKATDPEEISSMFFTAGFCLLTAGLIIAARILRRMGDSRATATSLWAIGLRNITRRRGRSLSVMGMMASGLFLVIAVNSFRIGAEADASARSSGTGGFALMGESTLPIYENLNTEAAWDAFALDDKLMKQVKVIPFRVRMGDDASCLNLNRAQNPRLMAVDPKPLAEMKAFAFADGSWDLLQKPANGAIPAVADQATALWGLGKGVGDTLTYPDADGKPFQVRIVGLLTGSVLQGSLIIGEKDFLTKYPNAAGYRTFLIDCPAKEAAAVSAHLTRQLEARGLAIETTVDRLSRFSAVQNTYIAIFTILGGLGVLLGTAGLGVLAARNILERRGEFALMQAIGFRQGALRRMVLSEHTALLVAGLIIGLISAAISVLPDVKQSGGVLPVRFLAILNLGILFFGIAVCWLAGALALRGRLIDAVRRE